MGDTSSPSLSLPLSLSDLFHVLSQDAFALMKQSAYFINTARGAIVNEGDLCDALAHGEIAGAGIDVQVKEPPEEDSPLYKLAQTHSLLLTPHIGWQRIESRQRLIDSVAENIRSFLAGKPINLCS